jgi:hypothetical protein
MLQVVLPQPPAPEKVNLVHLELPNGTVVKTKNG